jgi:APA family basic amino acid/polyamine antiporter
VTRERVPDRLRRELGLFDATMIVAGSVIGVGIFTSTGIVAAALPHPGWLLLAWLAGGLVSLAGALTNAEMGASLPHAGGDYVYLREAFSPAVGFFAGWLTFFAVYCGTVGTLAAGFAEYLAVFAPGLPGTGVALAVTWLSTAIAWSGVRAGAHFLDATSVAKLGAIALLCAIGPWLGSGDWSRGFALPVGAADAAGPSGPLDLARAFSMALVPILFTYLGWNAPVYVASELRDPGRTLPRALVLGTVLVTVVYLLLNAVYLYALPVDAMVRVGPGGAREGIVRIAETAAEALFGPVGGRAIGVLVLLSILGCLNATVLVGARVVYAMALDRALPLPLAAVHATRGTPHVALAAQAGVASLLLVYGDFQWILNYTTFAVITLMILDGLALYRLRRRFPDLPRPYRAWGYPWVPALYVAASAGLWWNTLISFPEESFWGLAIAATALPAYALSRRAV